jgi:hypothetical protein
VDKYLLKEAAGTPVSNEKWESSLRRHSLCSIKAKRRHRAADLKKSGVLPVGFALSPEGKSSSSKVKSSKKAQRELFNTVFSGLHSSGIEAQGKFEFAFLVF